MKIAAKKILKLLGNPVVMGRQYTIRVVDPKDDGGNWADVCRRHREVRISEDALDDPYNRLVPTIIHELLHAGYYESGQGNLIRSKQEEAACDMVEMTLTPTFWKLIKLCLKQKTEIRKLKKKISRR